MRARVEIPDLDGYDRAFGTTGANVGPRTGACKRSKDDEEWWVARRFLKPAIIAGQISTPLAVEKAEPPHPDFVLTKSGKAEFVCWIEITEATTEEDQREKTAFERSGKEAMLLGEFGGRFADGASQPGKAWAEDVVRAILRKEGKAIFKGEHAPAGLVIYPNSNASFLLSSKEDELTAIRHFQAALGNRRDSLLRITNGCRVHILGAYCVFIDVLGELEVIER